jgi:hypothetical protein
VKVKRPDRIRAATEELLSVFQSSATKHEANTRAAVVMGQLTREPAFLSAVLERYLSKPRALNRKNYPVVALDVALNPWFGLVANCWIPLPNRDTNLSTKAIHHHGDMLLTTATLFGPGYEHWMFTLPERVAEGSDRYTMKLIERAPHPHQHVSFVDAWTSHTPFYPTSLSITLALWSRQFPTTWRDRAKRLPLVRGNEKLLSNLVARTGLRKTLQLNVIESFDFFPTPPGHGGEAFTVMPVREEFALGPNADHVASVFHILQETGNEHLGRNIRAQLDRGVIVEGREPVERLLPDLERGRPIDGKLSDGHYDRPFANFTRDDVMRALRAPQGRERGDDGKQFPTSPRGQEAARPGAG